MVEPSVTRIGLLFPGQGSQFVGMGADIFAARPDLTGPPAEAVLGWSLEEMCRTGPEDRLTATDHAQPALYAVSYALWDELRTLDRLAVVAAGGHSLGEYTALAAAGALTYLDGLALVAARGRAMAAAAAMEASAMAALLGADVESAEGLCSTRRSLGGRLWVANLNAPGQVVIAGGVADIQWAQDHARPHGIRRVISINVAGAFHTPFMAPAAAELADSLATVGFSEPRFSVFSNLTGAEYPAEIPSTLVAQLTSRVRFQEMVEAMVPLVDAFVHVGPGDVTAGMARRIAPVRPTFVVNDIAGIPGLATSLDELENV